MMILVSWSVGMLKGTVFLESVVLRIRYIVLIMQTWIYEPVNSPHHGQFHTLIRGNY